MPHLPLFNYPASNRGVWRSSNNTTPSPVAGLAGAHINSSGAWVPAKQIYLQQPTTAHQGLSTDSASMGEWRRAAKGWVASNGQWRQFWPPSAGSQNKHYFINLQETGLPSDSFVYRTISDFPYLFLVIQDPSGKHHIARCNIATGTLDAHTPIAFPSTIQGEGIAGFAVVSGILVEGPHIYMIGMVGASTANFIGDIDTNGLYSYAIPYNYPNTFSVFIKKYDRALNLIWTRLLQHRTETTFAGVSLVGYGARPPVARWQTNHGDILPGIYFRSNKLYAIIPFAHIVASGYHAHHQKLLIFEIQPNGFLGRLTPKLLSSWSVNQTYTNTDRFAYVGLLWGAHDQTEDLLPATALPPNLSGNYRVILPDGFIMSNYNTYGETSREAIASDNVFNYTVVTGTPLETLLTPDQTTTDTFISVYGKSAVFEYDWGTQMQFKKVATSSSLLFPDIYATVGDDFSFLPEEPGFPAFLPNNITLNHRYFSISTGETPTSTGWPLTQIG